MNEADRWLSFAREDLRMANLALGDRIYNQVCFHSQQCVEKALKALYAIYRKSAPPRTHGITDLIQKLPSDLLTDIKNALTKLDDYYIPTRYPDALPGSLPDGLPERLDAENAISLARMLFEKAEQIANQQRRAEEAQDGQE